MGPWTKVAPRTEDGEGGPGADVERLPQRELGVVDDRVLDVVAADRVGDAGVAALVLKLGRVHAHHHEPIGHRVRLLELLQVRQNVLCSPGEHDVSC